jgi:mannose-6-phosphate isomerase-like protein (cupin superfamily)
MTEVSSVSNDIYVAGDLLAASPALLKSAAPVVRPTVATLAGLAQHYAAQAAGHLDEVGYDPVTRWYKRLAAADDHEVWLLSWLPGQGSGLHDHGDTSGVFAVVAGEMHERAYGTGLRDGRSQARERTLTPGSVHVFAPSYIHEMTNMGTAPAVSVHVYAPRLTTMRMYEGTRTRVRAAALEH